MFSLDAEEQRKAEVFIEETKSQHTGCSGGQYTYSFTPTTLGTITKLTDNVSGRVHDLTDYTGW
jgi:hypothetical protein